jgi:hypothetical protein
MSIDKTNRLKELNELETLTDSEMNEITQLSPRGYFKRAPNLLTIGVKNVPGFVENLNIGGQKSIQAFEQGFYIETISLRLQHIEIYLRMFYVFKNRNGKLIDSDTDKRTFGNFINDCKTLDFDEDLLNELKEFNEYRIKAIHKYILGEISYDDLKIVCDDTKGLDARVREYVFTEIGVEI